MNKAELVFKQQREKHENARQYAEQEVLKQEDDGHGNNEVYNKAYDYFLSEIYQEPDQDENGNKLKASCLNCGTPTEKYLMNKRNYFCCNNCEEEHQEPTLYATDDLKQLADDGIKKLCEGLK